MIFVVSSRTDPDDDDVVDVTSFSALYVVEIKVVIFVVVAARPTVVEQQVWQ